MWFVRVGSVDFVYSHGMERFVRSIFHCVSAQVFVRGECFVLVFGIGVLFVSY